MPSILTMFYSFFKRPNGQQEPNGIPDHMNPLALMAAISKSQRNGENVSRTSREMSVNVELVRKVFLKDSSNSDLGQNKKIEEINNIFHRTVARGKGMHIYEIELIPT